jgi:hypothetical protein
VRRSPAVRPAAGQARLALTGGLAAAVAAALALTGCATGDSARRAAPAARDAVSSATTSRDAATPTPSAVAAHTSSAPDRAKAAPDATSVPATTAGDLGARDVPASPDLGPGWTRYVDPGSTEAGYAGNGSWVRARDSADVVHALLPIGCARPLPRLPVPRHALEATYRGPGGAPAAALVLAFRDDAAARTFVAGVASLGDACRAPAGGVAADDPMATVVTQARVTATMVLQRRRELGVGAGPWLWTEAVVHEGRRVSLLAVASRPGADDRPDLAMLGRVVRASITR